MSETKETHAAVKGPKKTGMSEKNRATIIGAVILGVCFLLGAAMITYGNLQHGPPSAEEIEAMTDAIPDLLFAAALFGMMSMALRMY